MDAPAYLRPEGTLDTLATGDMELLGLMPRASNYTFAATVCVGEQRGLVIYKPQRGESPLRDFPDGTLYAREVAAWVVCGALGWDFVPPTVARAGPHGMGSVQLCIEPDPTEHYLTLLGGAHDDVFRRICAFDLVVNNADRKSGHVMREASTGRIWAVDHGVCFHPDDKLRTVIWDFAGEPLPEDVREALTRMIGVLGEDSPWRTRLLPLLASEEIDATAARAERLLAAGAFPDPPEDRRPYPWPPI